MPSEQRLHPATLLFDLAGHARRFAVPAIFVLFGVSRSSGGPEGNFGRIPSGWEVWLLVLLVPAILISIARYLSFRLRYDEHELVIRTGFIFRRVRHVPFSRIQTVDAVQNVFHRMLGVVEIRVETGGGKEEEARLSVLPHAAFEEMRRHVFGGRALTPHAPAVVDDVVARLVPEGGETLLHLPLKELLLSGLLNNKGLVLVGAVYGAAWETGIMRGFWEYLGRDTMSRGFFRELARALFDSGPIPVGRISLALLGFAVFLLLVRVLSMLWALFSLYDFRLTRVGEDLRTEYGLFTRISATVPIRRVQTITISSGPLYRWLDRATVRVETAGGAGNKEKGANVSQWLAPLIRRPALPALLQQVLPGFDLDALRWQPVHPRAFARAIKPPLIFIAIVATIGMFTIGWGTVGLVMLMLPWMVISTQQSVKRLGWAEADEMVVMRSGWIWQQLTVARVNKIQAVALHQSPFDRRAAMARVRVDTAGARELSHRIDIPYLHDDIARALAGRLSAHAANTAFRW
jgi:putative membrane protein